MKHRKRFTILWKTGFFTSISDYIQWVDVFLCKYVSVASELTWCAILQNQKILKFICVNKKIISKHRVWKCNCVFLEIVSPFKRGSFWPNISVIPFNFQISIRGEYFYPRWSTYILGNKNWVNNYFLQGKKYWGSTFSQGVHIACYTGIHLFKVNNGKTKVMYKICSRLTIKTLKRRRLRPDILIVIFKQISYTVLLSPLLMLNV